MQDFAKFLEGTPAIKINIRARLALNRMINKYKVMTPKPNSVFDTRVRVHHALMSFPELQEPFKAKGWGEDEIVQKLTEKCHGY